MLSGSHWREIWKRSVRRNREISGMGLGGDTAGDVLLEGGRRSPERLQLCVTHRVSRSAAQRLMLKERKHVRSKG